MHKIIKLHLGLTTKTGDKLDVETVATWLKIAMAVIGESGYTTYNATGWYKGVQEATLVLEVLVPAGYSEYGLQKVARLYTHEFLQECVLYTSAPVQAEFLSW